MKIYHLDFIAVLETRISGVKANAVIRRIGLQDGFRVEAQGFSGGIWCMWDQNCPHISVVASSGCCVHLKVNHSSPSF